jgi:hypothetical protein
LYNRTLFSATTMKKFLWIISRENSAFERAIHLK